MFAGTRAFFQRHPVLFEVLCWSIPALVFGALLRGLLLSYQPYAYWGSDSKSFYSFAHMLLSEGYVSLDEKRRYLYPITMVPISVLPGAPMKWLAWIQHALGLTSLLPIAYVVRRTMRFWRWWIIPVTLTYTSVPILLWYEHEMLAESLFFTSLAWAFGGWVAWASCRNGVGAGSRFWWFFVPLAVFLLTKPSGRFLLPGICVGLVMVASWRVLRRPHWIALASLLLVTLTVGSKKQAAWLLYVATFPLTQLDTALHAEYKAEIRSYAEPFVRGWAKYHHTDKRGMDGLPAPFDFLESPSEDNAPPKWAALDKDANQKRRVYSALAKEGVFAAPWTFIRLGWHRFVRSANLSEFGDERFAADYYPSKLAGLYKDAQETMQKGKPTSVPMAFGLPSKQNLPPYEQFAGRLTGPPGGFAEQTMLGWVRRFHRASDVVSIPRAADGLEDPDRARLTPLGWWCVAAILLAAAWPRTLGVWALAALGYLALMFLVSHVHTRYFAPAWVIFVALLPLPLDLLLRLTFRRTSA